MAHERVIRGKYSILSSGGTPHTQFRADTPYTQFKTDTPYVDSPLERSIAEHRPFPPIICRRPSYPEP